MAGMVAEQRGLLLLDYMVAGGWGKELESLRSPAPSHSSLPSLSEYANQGGVDPPQQFPAVPQKHAYRY